MTEAHFPLIAHKILTLSEAPFNLSEKLFRYNCLSLESDRYVCIKDANDTGSSHIVIVDLHHDNAIVRRPTKKAEAGLMHRKSNIIVLRGRGEDDTQFIQVYSLDSRARLTQAHFDDEIVFCKWATDDILAVITTKAVWHCDITQTDSCEKIFDRAGKLAETDVQIINYGVDHNVKWCFLAGISSQDRRVIDGFILLYSVERQQHQLLEGHTACFGKLVIDELKAPIDVFSFVETKNGEFKLHVMDIYAPRNTPSQIKVGVNFQLPSEVSNDFPLFMLLSAKYGLIFIVSRGGYVILVDALTGTTLLTYKISNDLIFVSCPNDKTGGVLLVNRKGVLYSVMINEDIFIQHIQQNVPNLNINDIAVSLVRRYGYPGADDVLIQSFNSAFARSEYKVAARIAASMKSKALRTPQTIAKFKSAPLVPNQVSPILQYFSSLLELSTLNAIESIELVRPVAAQGRAEFIKKWLEEAKLECTEELGDIVRPVDEASAILIYENANAVNKVLQLYVEKGVYEKIIHYAQSKHISLDYTLYLKNILTMNPEAAVTFSNQLLSTQPPLVEIQQIIDVFTRQSRYQELTSVLLNELKEDSVKNASLQTFLFDMTITHNSQAAEAIFQMNKFTYYDRQKIGQACEKASLYQRALEHYTNTDDIKRILANSAAYSQINSEWLVQYFSNLDSSTTLNCLADMIGTANRNNIQTIIQIAVKDHERIGVSRLIDLFESHGHWEGLFYFLGSILAFNQNPDVHFKYIVAASKLEHINEIERVCRESQYYDPIKVKDYLKEINLTDPRPLIYVCDRHNYVAELAEYLYTHSLMKYIEVYVTKVNPRQSPAVIGTLLDLNCEESFILQLLGELKSAPPTQTLIEEVEKRNRLKILQSWLEEHDASGNQDPEIFNALAKVYVDTNKDPEKFLTTNKFYDSKIIGKYCEDKDPYLAYVAYQKDWGLCDTEIVQLTNKNNMIRLQAKYLIARKSLDLWSSVLEENSSQLLDQTVSYALSQNIQAEEILIVVKALKEAQLNKPLMDLLDKLVFHHSSFSQNAELENLLITTAIQEDQTRVKNYVNRLDNFDSLKIAELLLSSEHAFYEEAFLVYKKHDHIDHAMNVLVAKIKSIERAAEYATMCNKSSVWATLAKAYLEQEDIKSCIITFVKAQDASSYKEVIQLAEKEKAWDLLIEYLLMAKTNLQSRDIGIDYEIIIAYAQSERLPEMAEFAKRTNGSCLYKAGDRLYEMQVYSAAEMIYKIIPDYSKTTRCQIKMKDFDLAYEAALQASKPSTWKELTIECVKCHVFKYATLAASNIISHPDHLDDLISIYEECGHYKELLDLLETGLQSTATDASNALRTELAIAYIKYQPDKLNTYIRHMSKNEINTTKLIRACEDYHLWTEAVYLYTLCDEYDSAANIMLTHITAWDHKEFLNLIQKATNTELSYQALEFYLEYDPFHLNEILQLIMQRVEHLRVINFFNSKKQLPLIQSYLEQVQALNLNLEAVNTAINQLYLESESIESLEKSIMTHTNFDQLKLASQLDNHELRSLRKLACHLYRSNRQYTQAIRLALSNQQYLDAIESAYHSNSVELAEYLLHYFIFDLKSRTHFAACLYACFHLIRPDVALEYAWRNQCFDLIMPYLIQTLRNQSKHIENMDHQIAANAKAIEKFKLNDQNCKPDLNSGLNELDSLAILPSSPTIPSRLITGYQWPTPTSQNKPTSNNPVPNMYTAMSNFL